MRKHHAETPDFDILYDMVELFASGIAQKEKTLKAKIIDNAESYLQKGEKIFSLAREKFSKTCCQFKITEFEQLLYGVDQFTNDLPTAIAKKVIRPILKSAVDAEDALLKSCLEYIDFDVTLEIIPNGDCRYRANYKMMREEPQLLRLTLKEEAYQPLVVYGLKDHMHAHSKANQLYRGGECVADIALVLTWLVMASVFKRVFADPNGDAYKDTLSAMNDHSVACRIWIMEHYYTAEYQHYWQSLTTIWDNPWLLPNDSSSFRVYQKIQSLLDYQNVTVEKSSLYISDLEKDKSIKIQSGLYSSGKDIPIIISDNTDCKLFSYDPFTFMKIMPEWFCYHKLLATYGNSRYWSIPRSQISKIIIMTFESAYHYKHTQANVLKNLKSLDSAYAKSYQTKKNIPHKTLTAMRESVFNDYFGYVEYDEDVDLKKVQVIAEEFVAFKETYLADIDSSENAIRFRRLGNHKASGLYYPSVSCLCVDINSPSSLIHEYAHLIDYSYGNLSAKSEFYQIKRTYEKRLRESMRTDKAFCCQMSGKTKYNLSYFLNPTEIFARSYEIYVKEVLNVKNSLTPSALGVPYPTDPDYIAMVKDYFEFIFSFIMKKEADNLALQPASCQN